MNRTHEIEDQENNRKYKSVSYHKEYLESSRTPTRVKRYYSRLDKLTETNPELKQMLKRLDKLLDKTAELCNNSREKEIEMDIMRARWCLGMD